MTRYEGSSRDDDATASRAGFTALAALGVAVILLVAAGTVGATMAMRGGHPMVWGGRAPDADAPRIQAAAALAGFQIDGLPSHVAMHYTSARANAETYAQVPCFCGCEEMLGHRNLEDCFVTPDGAWESHAAGCQVCIDESQMLMRMMGRGMGPETMRDRIVAGFGGSMIGG